MFTDQQIPVAFILAVAIVIQLGAAVMAFRLIGVTGRYMAWTLIAMAFTVMAIRSIIPLYHLVSGNTSAPPDPLNEFFGLVLSVLLAAGLARIGPLFVECKQAEQASRERSEDIRKLVQDSPVAMIVSSGTDQQVILLNKKFTELFGYTIQDIPDVAHWWPLAYPNEEYREEIKASWSSKVGDAIRAHSEIEPMEAAVTCKDGTLRCIEFRFSSIGTRNLITFVDLTERRQAAEILNSAGEGMYGTDVNGNILFVNPATTKILGYEADELCGRNSHQLFHSFTADGSPYPHEDCPLLKSLTHGEVYRGENEVFWGKAAGGSTSSMSILPLSKMAGLSARSWSSGTSPSASGRRKS